MRRFGVLIGLALVACALVSPVALPTVAHAGVIDYPYDLSSGNLITLQSGPAFRENDDSELYLYSKHVQADATVYMVIDWCPISANADPATFDAANVSCTVDGTSRLASASLVPDSDSSLSYIRMVIEMPASDFSVGTHAIDMSFGADSYFGWESDSATIDYAVKNGPAYKVSLSRGVSKRKAYIYITAKDSSGASLKGKAVKLYKGSKLVGKARTNSKGKAKFRVAKHYKGATYKAVLKGDSTHVATTKKAKLAFVEVQWFWTTLYWGDSTYLKPGRYKIKLETKNGFAVVRARGMTARLDTLKTTRTFTIRSRRKLEVNLWDTSGDGTTWLYIYRLM